MSEYQIKNRVLEKYVGKRKKVEVPFGVERIGERAFAAVGSIEEIVIPATVRSIGARAFEGCFSLKSVCMLGEINRVCNRAFAYCRRLNKINLEEVKEIGDEAFSYCGLSGAVKLKKAIKIGRLAFFDCRSITAVRLSSGLKVLERGVFSGCSKLLEIQLPEGLEYLDLSALPYGLGKIVVPRSVKEICGEVTFKSEYDPRVIFEGDYEKIAKRHTLRGDVVVVLKRNPVTVLDGSDNKIASLVEYIRERKMGVQFAPGVHEGNVAYAKRVRKKLYPLALKSADLMEFLCENRLIPLADLMQIEESSADASLEIQAMFLEYANTFSDSEREQMMEEEFFCDPFSLKGLSRIWTHKINPDGSVTLNGMRVDLEVAVVPENFGSRQVRALGDRVFKNKKTLREVIIPKSVKSLGMNLFAGCSLDRVEILGVQTLHEKAFNDCTICELVIGEDCNICNISDLYCQNGIKKITIRSDSKHYIKTEDGLFSADKRVLYKYLPEKPVASYTVTDGVEIITEAAFLQNENLVELTLPDSVKVIQRRAFAASKKLKRVRGGDGVEVIGQEAFLRCEALEEFTAARHAKSVAYAAFYGCTALISIDLGEVTSIAESVLAMTESLKEFTVSHLVKRIERDAFAGSGITFLYIPDTVEFVGASVAAKCKRLEGVRFPWGLSSFGEKACYKCPKLKEVFLPQSLTVIPESAFKDCKSLKSVNIPESVTAIGDNAFAGCARLLDFSLPQGLLSFGIAAFYNCESITKVEIPHKVEVLPHAVFGGCVSLRSVVARGRLSALDSGVFFGCKRLETLSLTARVKSVGRNAFYAVSKVVIIAPKDSYMYVYAKKKGMRVSTAQD